MNNVINEKFINKDDIKTYFSGENIQCLICNKLFKSLSTHIIKAHNIYVEQYKTMFGLPWSVGLCGCNTRDKLSNKAKTMIEDGKLLRGIVSKKHGEKLHKKGPRRITLSHSIDRSNFCKDIGVRNRKYNILNFDECWRLFNNGITQKEIGIKFGVSQMTISRFMRKANKHQ